MFVQMAFGKRKKVTAAKGSSSARYDRTRFVGPAQEARYQELETRVIFPERRIVPSDEGPFGLIWNYVRDTNWEKLFEPYHFYQVDIVREFYANALPVGNEPFSFTSWVRGKKVEFSKEAIQDFLDNPLALVEEGQCEYQMHAPTVRNPNGTWDVEAIRERICKEGKSYEVNAEGSAKHFLRKNLKTSAQLVTTMILYNLRP